MLYWVTHLVVKTFPLTEVQAAATYCPTAYWQLQPYASPCTYFLYQLVAGGWNRSKSRLGPNLPPISLTSHLWSNTVNLWPSFCRPPSLAPLACIVTFCEMRAICKWGNFSRIRARAERVRSWTCQRRLCCENATRYRIGISINNLKDILKGGRHNKSTIT